MIILALGSNLSSDLGSSQEILKLCIKDFPNFNVQVLKQSKFYKTKAYPNENDPAFVNCAISIDTSYSPIDLMYFVLKLEKKFGRIRNKINEPRTCDIDIIDYNEKKISFSSKDFKLEIPHPRLENRNFVLFPIKDLDSEWVSPLSGKSINQLIEELDAKNKNSITKI